MNNIKNDINWIYKRFLQAKDNPYSSFKVKDNDFKAFLRVVKYIDILHTEKVAKNTLFAKLYIYFLNQMIDIYKTDVLEDIPQKEISKILDIPIDVYFKRFHEKITSEWHDKIISKMLNKKELPKDFVIEKYSLEKVKTELTNMINQALNRFE